MIRFIDEYRNCFTIEFMCTTLKSTREGGFITSRGYRQPKARGMSARKFVTLVCSNTFATFTLITTAFMVRGRCGTRFAVKESLSVEGRLPG